MNYLFDIVNNTNLLLGNMNQYTKIATRKNRGKMISPIWANNQFFDIKKKQEDFPQGICDII